MNLSKSDKFIFYYIRVSLITGIISAISLVVIKFFELIISVPLGIFLFVMLLSSIPGYLILPGIIYKGDFETGLVFTMDQMIYYSFAFVTLGVGPSVIYFVKFDPIFFSVQWWLYFLLA